VLTPPPGEDEADRPSTQTELDALEALIDAWLDEQLADNPTVTAVDRDESDVRRWFVRLAGEERTTFTIWFTLGQRTLQYETFFLPAPEENPEAFYEHLLRRNRRLYGVAFCIGEEDATFLAGQRGNRTIDRAELDHILGSLYAYVEQCFRPALRLGFGSRLPPSAPLL
jgi:Putative bacterial sensory transduction regulator